MLSHLEEASMLLSSYIYISEKQRLEKQGGHWRDDATDS